MKTYEFEAPQALLKYELPGDLIVRKDAPPEILLESLCQMVRDDGGPSLRFRAAELPRQVVVARGTYKFMPASSDPEYKDSVVMYLGKLEPKQGQGGGGANVASFLAELGSRAGIRFINELSGNTSQNITYTTHRSTQDMDELPPGPQRDEKLRQLLDAISKQTGLQFTIETRDVSVWIAEPAPAQ
jgi:hypothetical protein